MDLFGYSDFVGQALHMEPITSGNFLVSPGDIKTQPLWLTFISQLIPDACVTLNIERDAFLQIPLCLDAEAVLLVAGDAHAQLGYDVDAGVTLGIGQDASVTLDSAEQSEEADILLNIRPEANATLEISNDGATLLAMAADADATLEQSRDATCQLEVAADAHITIDVEACDE